MLNSNKTSILTSKHPFKLGKHILIYTAEFSKLRLLTKVVFFFKTSKIINTTHCSIVVIVQHAVRVGVVVTEELTRYDVTVVVHNGHEATAVLGIQPVHVIHEFKVPRWYVTNHVNL